MPEIIVQAGYMSGDMFGVAAALKLKGDLRVLVVYDTNDEGAAKKMLELYKVSVGIGGAARVASKKVVSSRDFYKSMHEPSHASAATNRTAVLACFPGISHTTPIKAMGRSTTIVKTTFSGGESAARQQIVKQWEIDEFDELGLQRFMNRKGMRQDLKYVFLWIRLSGKQGGAHTELDSSRAGWQQIIDALPDGIIPVIIGDRFGKALTYKGGPVIDMTLFWNDIPFCLYKHPKFVGAEQRRAQFALFDYLVRASYKVCHLGMRSGVLESVALMGGKVMYMEERGNPQQSRIEELSKSMSNFDRLELNQLPTARGKVIDANNKLDWKTVVGPHVSHLAKQCMEPFPAVAKRVSAVEASVKLGAPFATYYQRFVQLSIPVWQTKYPSVANWATYEVSQKAWCDELKRRVKRVYDVTWSKEGVAKGFAGGDLANIVTQIQTRLT